MTHGHPTTGLNFVTLHHLLVLAQEAVCQHGPKDGREVAGHVEAMVDTCGGILAVF